MKALIWGAALVAVLSACNQSENGTAADRKSNPPSQLSPELRETQYLLDPQTGKIVPEIPPAVLTDVKANLLAQGKDAEAINLEKLYDFATGKVRDGAHAKAMQERLDNMDLPAGEGKE